MTDPKEPSVLDKLDKIMFDIYNIGRTDARLKVDDYTTLRPKIKSEILKHYISKQSVERALAQPYPKGFESAFAEIRKRLGIG